MWSETWFRKINLLGYISLKQERMSADQTFIGIVLKWTWKRVVAVKKGEGNTAVKAIASTEVSAANGGWLEVYRPCDRELVTDIINRNRSEGERGPGGRKWWLLFFIDWVWGDKPFRWRFTEGNQLCRNLAPLDKHTTVSKHFFSGHPLQLNILSTYLLYTYIYT